jgi:hypothetical protein
LVRLTKSRLFQPNLNCPQCHKIFVENKKKPACWYNRCDIVDIAPNVDLNNKVSAFFAVESFEMAPAYAEFAKKILRDSGLDQESPSTILEMRAVLMQYRDYEAQKNKPRKK